VGVGTGVISITLNKYFGKNMTSVDINEKAIKLTKKNALILNANITVIKKNIFEYIPVKKFDFLISNPPYIDHNDPNVSK
jgi:release factor glutamine methyltransferase